MSAARHAGTVRCHVVSYAACNESIPSASMMSDHYDGTIAICRQLQTQRQSVERLHYVQSQHPQVEDHGNDADDADDALDGDDDNNDHDMGHWDNHDDGAPGMDDELACDCLASAGGVAMRRGSACCPGLHIVMDLLMAMHVTQLKAASRRSAPCMCAPAQGAVS